MVRRRWWQVDLGFFKEWVPAVKAYAADALNKSNFGMWGEFFVETPRYVTMVGRGKEPRMYGNSSAYIDDVFTLNNGIVYPYYHWLRFHLLGGEYMIAQYPTNDQTHQTNLAGAAALHSEQRTTADLFNPQTHRLEETMWTFCNNHDRARTPPSKRRLSGAVGAAGPHDGRTLAEPHRSTLQRHAAARSLSAQ